MIYVFTFLGEFGYELFNWQGIVRKFKETCSADDKIVIGGRTGMDIWYSYADVYIDISGDPFFNAARADSYTAYDLKTIYRAESVDRIKASVQFYISEKLKEYGIYVDAGNDVRFIFSSDFNLLNGIYFGAWRKIFSIYGGEGYKQNLYAKIDFDSQAVRKNLETRLNFDLSAPYVLVQGRKRDIVIRSTYVVPVEKLIERLAEKIPVVILNFDTGRAWDSRSQISAVEGCFVLKTASAHEQAILIKHAAECVFVTENDFGSHIYVPPFMGRDVLAIAGADVYRIGTTPIKFWNDEIFKFGGKIIPFVSEEIFLSERHLNAFCDIVLNRTSVRNFFTELEDKASKVKFEDMYLWPNTPPPPDTHQNKIIERVGVSDYDTDDSRSRSHLIINFIDNLIKAGLISPYFTLADLCGGDAIIGTKIKEHYPQAEIIVQDCFKGKFSSHEKAAQTGVKLYGGFLQHLIEKNLSGCKLDIVMMLNTFRGWQSAKLRAHEKDLPNQTLTWLETNAEFFIVTATDDQIEMLEKSDLKIIRIGKGEDDSHMICLTKKL